MTKLIDEFRHGWQGISQPSALFSIGFAICCLASATAARWGLAQIRPDVFFTPYFPAVFFATAVGGFRIGIATALVGGTLGVAVNFSNTLADPARFALLLIFWAVCGLMIWGVEHYRTIVAQQREIAKRLIQEEEYRKLQDFKEVIPLSALKRDGLDLLLSQVVAALPAGPRYFPEDQITDQPARFMAAEIVREQVLLATKEEVPYSTTVVVEQFEEGAKLTRVAALIYCERESQKAILVGKGGQMLKKIGTGARLQIERMLGMKVFLELFVKVQPGWRDSRAFVDDLDWRRQLESLSGLPTGGNRGS